MARSADRQCLAATAIWRLSGGPQLPFLDNTLDAVPLRSNMQQGNPNTIIPGHTRSRVPAAQWQYE